MFPNQHTIGDLAHDLRAKDASIIRRAQTFKQTSDRIAQRIIEFGSIWITM